MNATAVANEQAGSLSAAASIVHDLRNPLSTIHGSAEMLIGSRLSEPQLQRLARNVYGASMRIRELLDEFLTRYGSSGIRVQPTDLHGLVTRAVDTISLLADAQSVTVHQHVPLKLAISLDPQRMQRVLVNLLVNALDVMPDGGTIRISAVPMRDFVLIQVCDTGPGIAPEIRERLFQPFATAGKPGGLGLGLAFSRQAVLDQGGQIWAESSSQGATFAIRLPMVSKLRVTSG
jgi:signal transduction histidine kinase